jgi:DNA polymerase III alpha subunit
MRADKFGNLIYDENDLLELVYQDKTELLEQVICEPQINIVGLNLKKISEDIYNMDIETFDSICQQEWFLPSEYKDMDIEGYLVSVCPKENYQRLIEELQEFRTRDMINLLRWLKYFVDTCRKQQIVWGVGRGSSVASYVLYLIGVHKIDPIKYKLDWWEFLR